MSNERIQSALAGATDTRAVVIEEGALARVADVFRENFPESRAVVVADGTEYRVAGEEVQRVLEQGGIGTEEPYVFPAEPTLYAKYSNIELLVGSLEGHDAVPVAVGSGTLNDIAKRAAYETDRPYMNVATAASMDGYTAFGASIEKDGHKQTLTCPAPRAVLADVSVLVAAPKDMTAAGYADLLGKVTSGADWLVADALGVEPIDKEGWRLVQDGLRGWVADPEALAAGESEAMDGLIEGLVMSGLAMQAYQSSRTASGAEHQFSHLWEGEGLGRDRNPPLSHGFKVGVGSVAVAALYERLLARDLARLDVEAAVSAWPSWPEVEERVRALHTLPELERAAVEQSRAKYVGADALRERLELLREVWPELSGKLRSHLLPAEELRRMLRAAGCPVTPEEIGLSRDELQKTYRRALTIRSRYTVLDLANETGILDECVAELFEPGGFWAR
ncbi:Glycerol dehydrogenase-related enzyme (plasmid) [Rubrobacter radiotolerans]|nr:sn-glycerol-1-phosphate dehydrogenase [Rubrobacter radiotolerans]AHY48313.1 Glycerol dehydrogenase-related enzyme [Rubrobacter radiotolerans]SMC01510.1 glycerol-1-phosphate dehydrogenase [NAD(P)+] [Rubrobacter radiotolerans DSM 5868]